MIFDRLLRKGVSSQSQIDALMISAQQGWSATGAGQTVTPSTALRLSTVFACVRVLAESVGHLPIHLFKDSGEGPKKLDDHPLASVLHDAPNGYQTAQEWIEQTVLHLALRGNAYSLISRIRGDVRELHPVSPDAVTANLDANYRVTYSIRMADGRAETVNGADVLHIRLMAPDGLLGLSPIQQAREAIGLSMATEQHGARLFANGARPGGLLTTDAILNKATEDRLKTSWEERHQGADNAHRIAVLHAGLKYQPMGMSNEDAQFLETRKYQRTEIAGIFRVPLHMIGDLERATFSNIEWQSLEFVQRTLLPYLSRIEARIRRDLVKPSERGTVYAKFNVASLLRADATVRSQYYTRMLQAGVMSPNEIRALEEMPPREGGDVYLTPVNMTQSGPDAEEPEPAPAPAPGPGGQAPGPMREGEPMPEREAA